MLRLQTEQIYRSLIFASSDHLNPQLWPELEVCWDPSQEIENHSNRHNAWEVFPNPANEQVNITFHGSDLPHNATLRMYAIDGKEIMSIPIKDFSTLIQIDRLSKGFYLIMISSEYGVFHKKIIRQ
jgi:hypothetical protein